MAELPYPDYPHYPRPWSHASKVEYMLRDLAGRGITPYAAAPPFFRLLWKLGMNVPPPLFLGFAGNALVMAGFFGVCWGLWLLVWVYVRMERVEPVPTLIGSVFCAVCFSSIMAGLVCHTRRKLRLPAWRDYPPQDAAALHQPL